MSETAWFTFLLLLAYILDAWAGDPRYLPHPVRLIGKAIDFLEALSRRLFASFLMLKIGGAILVLLVGGGSFVLTLLLLEAVAKIHPAAELALMLYLLFVVLAGGDLRNHLLMVLGALQSGNLPGARRGVSLLVSRDTGNLGEEELSRASLESLFENTADGLVAPLFYAALGGAPLAVFYKVVNTADSMLGYRTPAYRDLGWAAARLDDVLSYLPSRLSALFFGVAGLVQGSSRRAFGVLAADHNKHESPNSAWPEAAAAGVLGVRLGGKDTYGQEVKFRPVINAGGRPPGSEDLRAGLVLYRNAGIIALAVLLAFAYLWRWMGVLPW